MRWSTIKRRLFKKEKRNIEYLPVVLLRCYATWLGSWGHCVDGNGHPWIRGTFYSRAGHCQRIRPTPSCHRQKHLINKKKEKENEKNTISLSKRNNNNQIKGSHSVRTRPSGNGLRKKTNERMEEEKELNQKVLCPHKFLFGVWSLKIRNLKKKKKKTFQEK